MSDSRPPLDPIPGLRVPSVDLTARVRASVGRTPAPRSRLRERLLLALLAIPLAVAAGPIGSHLVFAKRAVLRVDAAELPLLDLSGRLAVLLVLAGIATGIALAPGRRGLGSKITLLVTVSVVVAPLYTLVTTLKPLRSATGDAAARQLHELGLPCALVAFSIGVLALTGFGLALRRAVPVAPVGRAAALGAAAGAWAGVALFLHCPAHNTPHLLVGHALPVAAFALAGALLLPRALRP